MASGIGDTLRATRRQQRLSLAEAAAEIRVREPYLAALEEEKFTKLGGDVYVRAFLRGYSEFLGLDPDQVVEAYRREHEHGARPPQELPAAAPTAALPATTAAHPSSPSVWEDGDEYDDLEPRPSFFPRAVVLAGVVLLMLVVAVLALRQRDNGATAALGDTGAPTQASVAIPTPEAEATMPVTPVAEPTVAATAEPLPSAASSPPPAPAPLPQGPLTELTVELTVVEGPSWLRATADGTVAEVGIYEPGTTFTWTAEESMVLRIGDASNVRVVLNGVDQGVLGGEREPRDLEYQIGEPPPA